MTEKETLIQLFTDFGIPHGTQFDNGTLWCEVCESTKTVASNSADGWSHKMCKDCTCVWPEYAHEIVAALMDGECGEIGDLVYNTLH
jgi:hypothetical protein